MVQKRMVVKKMGSMRMTILTSSTWAAV